MRVARPTNNLTAIAEMYSKGLDLEKLSQFTDHDGFDGVILGHPGHPYHLEFTSQREHETGTAPTKEHLLVFYIPDQAEWEETCERMLAAGFLEVSPYNPFWDIDGRTFEDLDGYRVVLQKIAWTR
jgi:hypothetical protein